jgi:hypothetical protein
MDLMTAIDLRTSTRAAAYEKHETVEVEFALTGGSIQSREGENSYCAGDALITGSTGDRWSVARKRFDAKYLPLAATQAGQSGRYANIPAPVLAQVMPQDFSIERQSGGDVIQGKAGDWLLQYAPGDHGIVAAAKFSKVYQRIE